MKKQYVIPIFVPHLGCPNDCIFCNQKSISGQKKNMTRQEAKNIIETHLKSINKENSLVEIAFFGGSFTAIEEKQQEELLGLAYEYIKNKKVDSIRVSTRPDYINKTILKRLKKYKVKTIELGVQSANDYVLKRANRGHNFEDVKKASKLIRWNGFTLGHQMMVGLPESSRADEINTAKAAHIHHYIKTLSKGYDAKINEESTNISAGQKQLLTIARVILADPKILILDEATSSIDTRTEQQIQAAMDNLMEGRTSFIIAHRLSTIKNADLILVMDHGDIVEQGTHEELLAKGESGFYYKLYNSQFEDVQ